MFTRTLRAVAAAAAVVATAAPARAQDYVGPFATSAAGGTARFAQTFGLSGDGAHLLTQYQVALGDFSPDASGAALQFRTSVFTIDGARLGTELYRSDVRAGSAHYSDFDYYLFKPDVLFAPNVTTFAVLLEAVGGPANSRNVIATLPDATTASELYTVDAAGAFAQDTGTDAFIPITYQSFPDSTVPEPGTVALVAVGLVGAAGLARRRRAA